jgi:hypothetical protein
VRRRVGWQEREERAPDAPEAPRMPLSEAVLAMQRGAGNAVIARAFENQVLYYAALNPGAVADWEEFEELPGDEVVGEGAAC